MAEEKRKKIQKWFSDNNFTIIDGYGSDYEQEIINSYEKSNTHKSFEVFLNEDVYRTYKERNLLVSENIVKKTCKELGITLQPKGNIW